MYPLFYIWECLRQLEKKIEQLKLENEELQKKIAAIQPVHIENMEYKINELKVDTLSGCMNMGISAKADEDTMKNIMDHVTKDGKFNFGIGDDADDSTPPSKSREEKTKKSPEKKPPQSLS